MKKTPRKKYLSAPKALGYHGFRFNEKEMVEIILFNNLIS